MSRYYFYELRRKNHIIGDASTLGIGGEYVFPLIYETIRFSCHLNEIPGVSEVWLCSCEALGKLEPTKVGEIVMPENFSYVIKDNIIILEDVRFGSGEYAEYPSIITRQPFLRCWNNIDKKYEPDLDQLGFQSEPIDKETLQLIKGWNNESNKK